MSEHRAKAILESCGYLDNDWMNPEDIQPLVNLIKENERLQAKLAKAEAVIEASREACKSREWHKGDGE